VWITCHVFALTQVRIYSSYYGYYNALFSALFLKGWFFLFRSCLLCIDSRFPALNLSISKVLVVIRIYDGYVGPKYRPLGLFPDIRCWWWSWWWCVDSRFPALNLRTTCTKWASIVKWMEVLEWMELLMTVMTTTLICMLVGITCFICTVHSIVGSDSFACLGC